MGNAQPHREGEVGGEGGPPSAHHPHHPVEKDGDGRGGGHIPAPYGMDGQPFGTGGVTAYPPNAQYSHVHATSLTERIDVHDARRRGTGDDDESMGVPTSSSRQSYQNPQATGGVNANTSTPLTMHSAELMRLEDDVVPTVFRWEHGGRQVYVTGTFNGWSRQIPMHRSGNDFTYIHNLVRGKHAFKFIVDDEWRYAPDQPTVSDIEGRINNFIDVTDFRAYTGDRNFEERSENYSAMPSSSRSGSGGPSTPKAAASGSEGGGKDDNDGDIPVADQQPTPQQPLNDSQHNNNANSPSGMIVGPAAESANKAVIAPDPDDDDEGFSNNMPDLDDYTKEPPPLPPHLRHIILNKPPQLSDTAALPVPQHVALNHLYCTAIKDNMMVLGVTQRYKTKFVTTVYYSPTE